MRCLESGCVVSHDIVRSWEVRGNEVAVAVVALHFAGERCHRGWPRSRPSRGDASFLDSREIAGVLSLTACRMVAYLVLCAVH